jgi:hypothetical protein
VPRVKELKINSVWSAHGHVFIGSGEYEYDDVGNLRGYYHDCLSCGAHYVLAATPDAFSDGAYVNGDGDAPVDCTHDTDMCHGDPHEQNHGLDCPEGCAHCRHACNCVICTG